MILVTRIFPRATGIVAWQARQRRIAQGRWQHIRHERNARHEVGAGSVLKVLQKESGSW